MVTQAVGGSGGGVGGSFRHVVDYRSDGGGQTGGGCEGRCPVEGRAESGFHGRELGCHMIGVSRLGR